MIVTVTANPALDKTLCIRGFRLGTINRAVVERVDIGGKGINVAQNLARLGCDVVATGFLGAQDRRAVEATLAAQGVRADFVRVAGDLRVNLKILDPTTGLETEVNESGQVVCDKAMHALGNKLRRLARRCSVMVFSGSLPPGAPDDLYARYIRIAAGEGARTILDTAGAALQHGITAAPDLVKPNRAETEELLGTPLGDDSGLVAAARTLLEQGARMVVISLGAQGSVPIPARRGGAASRDRPQFGGRRKRAAIPVA
jgi:1-phosphofructokinase